ncbi:MAG: galactonate dehydratase [Gemmatimonadetes bacterium]|jgi:galactonate dehydratase|nr:galactonate dehydratase [Gemmatimonadota bacterium]
MKITRFEIVPLKQRGLFLQVYTDEGLIGYGSPMNYEHGRTVERAVHDMGDYLIGRDPRQIEDHWQVLFRSSYSRQMPILLSALSGIEMACLDILGKSVGLPIWQLLGGSVRERLRVYGSAGGSTPEQCAENARKVVARGFTALKTTPFPEPVRFIDSPAVVDSVISRISAMREAVGPQIDIAIDFHRAVSPAMAKILLRELEPLKPMFVEEPTRLSENPDVLLDIARSTPIPIASGERNTTRWGFREMVEKRAAAVLQPDVRHCGGILEMKKIAAMAEVYDIAVAPHSAADPLGIVASVHAMAGTPNFLIQEFGGGAGEEIFLNPLQLQDGFVDLPRGPGLGVDLSEEGLEANRHTGEWRLRTMRRHPDDDSFSDF